MSSSKIQAHMTAMPYSIDHRQPLKNAKSIMRKFRIRHLPVKKGKRIIGVLSDRNVKAASLTRWADQFLVEDVMISDPYVVEPGTSIAKVLDKMIDYKYGCAIVQKKSGELVGIFTTIDALKMVKKQLHQKRKRRTKE